VAHDADRDRVRNAARQEQSGCAVPERVKGHPLETLRHREPLPTLRERGRQPRLPDAVVDHELRRHADHEQPFGLRRSVPSKRPCHEVRQRQVPLPRVGLGRTEAGLAVGVGECLANLNASSTSDQRRPSTSSRRSPRPSAKWTAASHGSVPWTALKIRRAVAASMISNFGLGPTGRFTSCADATLRPMYPLASALESAIAARQRSE